MLMETGDVQNSIRFCGIIDNIDKLPKTGQPGQFYLLEDTTYMYVFNGEKYDKFDMAPAILELDFKTGEYREHPIPLDLHTVTGDFYCVGCAVVHHESDFYRQSIRWFTRDKQPLIVCLNCSKQEQKTYRRLS